MASRLLEFLKNDPLAYAEYLSQLSYDELVEINLRDNTCRNIEHVAGKYHVPILSGSYEEVYRYSVRNMIHPEEQALYASIMDPAVMGDVLERGDGTVSFELRYRLIDNAWAWVKQIIVYGPRFGLPEGTAHCYIFDISNRKSREIGQMPAAANLTEPRDGRTLLYRERPFFVHAQKRINDGLDGWCLLMIDVEHFRLFNDWYGRTAGDMLLAEIGACLARREEQLDAVAGYLGQDNFCLLMPFIPREIDELAQELQSLIAGHGAALGFLPSLGVRPFEGMPQVMDLMDDAAMALKEVKRNYRARICVFRPEMRGKSEENYRMLLDFQSAIDNGEIYFCLQPQCRISSRRIVGAECLARWRKPDGTMVSPAEFIPVLEQYGFITDLDTFIWEQLCRWLRRWMDAGHRPIPISVNVSPLDLFNINVPERFAALTEKYGIPRQMLKVEITESAYASDEEHIGEAVQQFQRLGFSVLMDDFGSGYSSLNMLRDIHVDAIKLDARFLQLGAQDSVKGIRIIESVFNMTQTMAIPVIVEGVEASEQSSYLADLGCRYIQGFLYYRPMPPGDFELLAGDDEKVDYDGIAFKANEELHVREFLDANIYNDVMLNNILGAVAFFSRNGEHVDITRFNERFYQLCKAPDFQDNLKDIQKLIHPVDLPAFYGLFDRADADRLNGASGVIRIILPDDVVGRFLFRIYFLEEGDSGRKYYSSMEDITESTRLQAEMRMLSLFSTDSIVFLRNRKGKYSFHVVIHGLYADLGLDQAAFEEELNSQAFFNRIVEEERAGLRRLSLDSATQGQGFHVTFRLVNTRNEVITLDLKTDYVHDENTDVEYIICFRRREGD